MYEFKVVVKGVTYHLSAYKELRNELGLVVDGKLVCDSKPYYTCVSKFIELVGD